MAVDSIGVRVRPRSVQQGVGDSTARHLDRLWLVVRGQYFYAAILRACLDCSSMGDTLCGGSASAFRQSGYRLWLRFLSIEYTAQLRCPFSRLFQPAAHAARELRNAR